jgi:RNA polymerase sigma-70 factor (ECF subfamily)
MVLADTQKEVIEGCQQGDPDAQRALFERHKDAVYSIAFRYSGNSSQAQDLAQEAFIKIFAAIGTFRADSSFESWLYRIVVNTCFDHHRKRRRIIPLFDDFLNVLRDPRDSVLDRMIRSEHSSRVQSLIKTLPAEQRMIVVLRYTQGLSYEEIGEILGLPHGTVASRLNRAHKALERRLTRLMGIKGKNV